jgi:hypothetical protein
MTSDFHGRLVGIKTRVDQSLISPTPRLIPELNKTY